VSGTPRRVGYRVVGDAIARTGATTVFSMLGESNVVWIGEGVRAGLFRLVKTRHESSAVMASAAYGRVTGTLGVCSVSHGAGFTNAIHALTACAANHQPVLVLTGMEPSAQGRSIDQRAFARAAGVDLVEVHDVDELALAIGRSASRAVRTAVPQVVSLDPTVQDLYASDADGEEDDPTSVPLDPSAISTVVDLLEAARHPLLLAGQGAVVADARPELDELADLVGADVATTLVARHFFAGSDRDLGLCGGWAVPETRQVLVECDLVVGFGASFDPHTFGPHVFPLEATAVSIDVDPMARATAPDSAHVVEADAKRAAAAMVREWQARGHGRRARPRRPSSSSGGLQVRPDPSSHGLDLLDVLRTLDALLPADRLIVTDSGRHLPAVVAQIGAVDARHFVVSRGHGSVGLGLGAAVGAAAGARGRPVVLVCGDGGLMMAAQELDSIRLNGLDLTIVVLNDEQYGAEVAHLTDRGLPADVARQRLPDVSSLARAHGGTGRVVSSLDGLDVLRELGTQARTGLTIIDVRIDPVSGDRLWEVSRHGASARSR